jgi:hypothetical protein
MIRNILYSLFFHFLIILALYFNVQFQKIEEIETKSKVTVSFITKPGISEKAAPPHPEVKNPKPPEPDAEIKPAPKKAKPKEKDNLKEVKKISKDKPDKSDTKSKKTAPPKTAEVKPVESTKPAPLKPENPVKPTEAIKAVPVKEEIKPLAVIKKEQKPQIIRENAKTEVKEVENDEDEREGEVNQPKSAEFSDAQKLENVDLLVREKFNIQVQIRRCYRRAIDASKKDSKVPVYIHIIIDKDGTIDMDSATIQDYEKYKDPKEVEFKIAVDNVRRALNLCSPLRNLPEDKYDVWKELTLQFDENMKD